MFQQYVWRRHIALMDIYRNNKLIHWLIDRYNVYSGDDEIRGVNEFLMFSDLVEENHYNVELKFEKKTANEDELELYWQAYEELLMKGIFPEKLLTFLFFMIYPEHTKMVTKLSVYYKKEGFSNLCSRYSNITDHETTLVLWMEVYSYIEKYIRKLLKQRIDLYSIF